MMTKIEREKKIQYSGILVSLFITLKPIYIWSSGVLQLCDFVMLFGFFAVLIHSRGKIRLDKRKMNFLYLMLSLCLYQFLVNAVWTSVLNENIMRSTLYYIYNLFAVCFFFLVDEEIGTGILKHYIMIGCFCSLVITTVGIVILSGTGRSTGFFNNPNQLGYYALLVFALTILCGHETSLIIRISSIVMSIFAIVASSSKAAFFGMIITMLLYIFINGKKTTWKKVIIQILLICVAVILIYILLFSDNSVISSNYTVRLLRYRVLNMSKENDTSLGEGRGYNRVFEMDFHLLWGMGEGAFHRFVTLKNLEVHSSFVSLLVSYGLIGLFGYLILFYKALGRFRRQLANYALISGLLFYQLSHNGIRNTLFWLLIAVMLVENCAKNNDLTNDNCGELLSDELVENFEKSNDLTRADCDVL